MMVGQERRRSLFGPVILIGLGVLFLLNNFDLVSWEPWFIIQRFWPILLVAAGLDIWSGRRSVFNGLMHILFTIILLGLLALGVRLSGDHLSWQLQEITVKEPLPDATQAEISLNFDVGGVHLQSLPQSDPNLISGTIHLNVADNSKPGYRLVDDTAYLTLRSETIEALPLLQRWDSSKHWDLAINPQFPIRLRVNTGFGLNTLDLTDLDVVELDVESAFSDTVITLPEQGQIQARIHNGIGHLLVRIPRDLPVQIRSDSRLVDTKIDGDYQYRNGVYLSPGIASQDSSAQIDVSGHLGTILIQQIDPE